ncbi:EamA family transporter [Candidatus Bathyarchaeota archaeon]|nr:EamA family transporter [Candidatus Bathyarchaeota archaeon]
MQAKVAAAFAAVYVIWGSTYLAIKFVIETIPPFFMAGTRFIIAGLVLYAFARIQSQGKAIRETKAHWGRAFIIGGLMLLGGHGAVVWTEQWVPSGLVSLLIATVPLWMVFVDWLRGGSEPSGRIASGLVLGFVGVALLVGGLENLGESQVDIVGAAIVVFGAFLWANGSLYSRSAKLPSSPLLATAMQMTAGGLLLLLASLVTGEYLRIRLDLISARSLASWIYLIVFGALVAFTSYIWLLKVTTSAKVSTYAYVNPIVAMVLGWALAAEPLTLRNILAAAIILTAVILITTHQPKRKGA